MFAGLLSARQCALDVEDSEVNHGQSGNRTYGKQNDNEAHQQWKVLDPLIPEPFWWTLLFLEDFYRAHGRVVYSRHEVDLDFALGGRFNVLEGLDQRPGTSFPEDIESSQ